MYKNSRNISKVFEKRQPQKGFEPILFGIGMIATRNKSQNGTTALLPSFLGSGNRSLLPRKTIYYQSKVLIFIGKGYTTAWLAFCPISTRCTMS